MIYCSKCGVELEEEVTKCPLCGKSSSDSIHEGTPDVVTPSDIITLHRKENRKHTWELAGIIAFSGIVACTSVDLLVVKGLSWAQYADVSIFTAWVILTIILRSIRKPLLALPALLTVILTMLLLFDIFSRNNAWFLPLGLPITISAFLTVAIIVSLYKIAHFKGFNILAAGLLASSLFCIIIEFFIDRYLNTQVAVRWSLIVTVSILPIVMVLFFIHYRMKKGKHLNSFFHV
jgi:hypothetical protein